MIGTILWVLLLVASGGLEAYAIRHHDDRTFPTATHVILSHFPRWLIATGLGAASFWLVYHFLIQARP